MESVDARRQQGAQVKTYRESTASERNEAGADAAAVECKGIGEKLHEVRGAGREGEMPKRGKKYLEARSKVNREAKYSLDESLDLLKETAHAKFDETVEVAMRLGVDPKYPDQQVRGSVVLPHGTGKSVRVLVFSKGEKVKEAQDAGADFVGSDDLLTKIQGGWLDFDKAVATPDMMGGVGRIGKILGPRGLMPNPKVGTVTFDVGQAVRDLKGGRVECTVAKAGIVHVPI